ncbi:MAG: M56 family metallopeptidase [bacterium]|nr:M56 family metallopeptidase [bacterium]
MLIEIFKTVIAMSAAGTAAALLLLAAKPITKRHFGVKWQYYAWLAAIVLMLIPMFTLIEPKETADVLTAAPSAGQLQPISEKHVRLSIDAEALHYVSFVWLIGVLALLTIRLVNYARFAALISCCPDADAAVSEKRIRVKICGSISSPLLIGVISPILLLPHNIPKNNMKYILRHELVHYRRKDVLFKWVTMLVCSIHWFNPFVYIIALNIDEACEISCDEEATKGMSVTEQKCYMNAVLELMSAEKKKSCRLTTSMASGKKLIIKRFAAIADSRCIKRPMRVISVLTGALIAVTSITAGGVFAENADIITAPLQTKLQQEEAMTEITDKEPHNDSAELMYSDNNKELTGIEDIPEYRTGNEAETLPEPELYKTAEGETKKPIKEASEHEGKDKTVRSESKTDNGIGEAPERIPEEYELEGGSTETDKELPNEKAKDNAEDSAEAGRNEEKSASVEIGAERSEVHEALGKPESVTYEGVKETYNMNDGSKVILHYEEERVYRGYRVVD